VVNLLGLALQVLRQLLLRLCHPDPCQRPTALEAMADPWFSLGDLQATQEVVPEVAPLLRSLVRCSYPGGDPVVSTCS